jgi:hypothetical protein
MKRLCLSAENPSSIGDDTFWLWAKRTFPGATFEPPVPGDTALHYSTLGGVPDGVRGIGLLWELYPEMQRVLGDQMNFSDELARIEACVTTAAVNVVPTELVGSLYPGVQTQVLPIGVDFDLWMPRNKEAMREKYGLPPNAKIGMWCGTRHPMKGYDILWQNSAMADHWIVVWKVDTQPGAALRGSQTVFYGATQNTLAELMAAADFYAVAGRLRPYFLVEYEAMACDTTLVVIGEPAKDFPVPAEPRRTLKDMGWDRADLADRWMALA